MRRQSGSATPLRRSHVIVALILIGALSLRNVFRIRSGPFATSEDSLQRSIAAEDKQEIAKICTNYYSSLPSALQSSGFHSDSSPANKRDFELHHVHIRRHLACWLLFPALRLAPIPSQGHFSWWMQEIRLYFQHYIDVARDKQLILFHHVSKSGGTTVCENAFLNGCRAPAQRNVANGAKETLPDEVSAVVGVNCYAYSVRDGQLWDAPEKRKQAEWGDDFSCARRKQFAEQYDLNFLANENYVAEDLQSEHCRTGILNYLVVREPLERLRSHYWHVLQMKNCSLIPSKCILNGMSAEQFCGLTKPSHRAKHYDARCLMSTWYGIANNYFVRTLGGEASFSRPPNSVTEHDFEAAMKNLRSFDVIALLGSPSHPLVERAMVGFPRAIARAANEKKYSSVFFASSLDKELTQSNELDMKLYRAARAMYALDVTIIKALETDCQRNGSAYANSHCEVFNSVFKHTEEAVEWDEHRNAHERWRFTKQQRKFACGCGWAGSRQNSTEVRHFLPRVLGVPATQMCPRVGLFE